MRLKNNGYMSIMVLCILLISFFVSGCDKYQSESYEISDVDARACAQIQDTLYNSIAVVELTNFDSTWTTENIPDNVSEICDSLKENGIVLSEGDLSTWVTTIEGVDTSFVCFETNLNSVILYSDRVVRLKLMDDQGEFRTISSISMPMETVGGCTTEEGNPQILTRVEYSVPDNEYLMYIINEENTFTSEDTEYNIILSVQ